MAKKEPKPSKAPEGEALEPSAAESPKVEAPAKASPKAVAKPSQGGWHSKSPSALERAARSGKPGGFSDK